MDKLFIIIPAYNEEENIRQVVDIVADNKAKLALCPYPLDKEVLLRIASWGK